VRCEVEGVRGPTSNATGWKEALGKVKIASD
jgi:hypothetical protein